MTGLWLTDESGVARESFAAGETVLAAGAACGPACFTNSVSMRREPRRAFFSPACPPTGMEPCIRRFCFLISD